MWGRLLFVILNSLGPSDAIWWQRSGSTLAQVIACCLMAPSHYLNQCWLVISKVDLRASSQEMTQPSITKIIWKMKYIKFHSNFPGPNEIIYDDILPSKCPLWGESIINQSPVDSPHKGPVMRSFGFIFMSTWTNCWINSQEANKRRYLDAHLTSSNCNIKVWNKLITLVCSLHAGMHPHLINTLRPRQNVHHFADIFKCIFLNENVWIFE